MSAKFIVILILFLVLAALFSGLYFLFRDTGKGERTLSALMWRVGFTVALMIILLVSVFTGIIRLHPV